MWFLIIMLLALVLVAVSVLMINRASNYENLWGICFFGSAILFVGTLVVSLVSLLIGLL